VWWHKPVIPQLRRLRQKDSTFQANLDYIVRSCLRKKKKKKVIIKEFSKLERTM
jgi:hypothetical protein